jgi:hypothetical protein
MTELVLEHESWTLSYAYQFFIVKHDDHQSLFVINRNTGEVEKAQYDFTRVIKASKTNKGIELVLDYKGELDFMECKLTPEDANTFLEFFRTATESVAT